MSQYDTDAPRLGGGQKLSLLDAVAQSIGFVGPVFSIAFLVPLLVGLTSASGRGAGNAAPLAVVLAAIGVLALGWIISEYARRISAAGSLYDYISDGLGSRVGGTFGLLYYVGILALGSGLAVMIGGTIHDTLAAEFGSAVLPEGLWDLVVIGLVGAILYFGVAFSTRAQLILALLSVATVFLFSLYVIVKVGGDNDLGRALSPSSSGTGFSGVLFGVLYGVLLFTGFETSANLGEETEHPKRDIPRAVLISVLLVAGFYFIATYAQVAGFRFDLKAMADAAGGPLFALASGADGGFGSTAVRRLLELVVVLDMLAVLIGCAVAASRGLFALARDRRLPAALANVSPRSTPLNATIVVLGAFLLTAAVTLWVPGFVELDRAGRRPAGAAALRVGLLLDGGARRLRARRDLPRAVGRRRPRPGGPRAAVEGLPRGLREHPRHRCGDLRCDLQGAEADDLRRLDDARRPRRQPRAHLRVPGHRADRPRVGRPLRGRPGPAEALTPPQHPPTDAAGPTGVGGVRSSADRAQQDADRPRGVDVEVVVREDGPATAAGDREVGDARVRDVDVDDGPVARAAQGPLPSTGDHGATERSACGRPTRQGLLLSFIAQAPGVYAGGPLPGTVHVPVGCLVCPAISPAISPAADAAAITSRNGSGRQESRACVRVTSSRQNAGIPSASSVYWPGLTHSVVKPSATRPGTCSSASGRLATASSAGNRARTPPTSSRSDGARPASARAAAKVARSASEGRPSGCQPLP